MEELDEIDFELYDIIKEYMPITLSELARNLGHSKSMIYRRVKKLENSGLIKVSYQGGVSIITANQKNDSIITIGILRASEYPYIIKFAKKLENIFNHVKIVVYDEAYKEALDLSIGKLKLAMNPAVSLLAIHRISRGQVHIIGGGSGGGSGIINNLNGKNGHSTSIMSSMELCADMNKLEMPRVYGNSGQEILNKVLKGEVRQGVIWEPFLSIASKNNLKITSCELDTCCLLGAHSSLYDKYDKISKAFSDAISSDISDLEGYANIINMPLDVIKLSVKSYSFFEEPDKNYLKSIISNLRNTILPSDIIERSVII
ncbi:MAG: MarR family transcriptional regulator [Caldisphaera sp.]|uniref:winged helix-turn-helix transcriptional regulator n=1 Tax=Caldisphaera sp. TaxID=2060322 RepID=UPI000CB4F37A|nr:MAG: MarR family transcriptional regulator [Caldisphaera sp.]PMP92363.1 MAG: MarR family transcriptional regulator [Caldisphaera sp.]